MFGTLPGVEKRLGTSIFNENEVNTVKKVVSMLLNRGITPSQIGVISPYKAQISAIHRVFSDLPELKIASGDCFQGSEHDYIVMSCVRSGDGIGFVADTRRLNVSITRAKYGLIIIGDSKTLARESPMWGRLVRYFRSLDAIEDFSPRDGISGTYAHAH
jgi:superfamily I DNA and/or RNA helicase